MTAAGLVLESGDACLTVDAQMGGRMTSLVVFGDELLVTHGDGPIRWGCYPMAPFAGRIREGRFTFDGRDVRLPLNLPPHAIHGTALERPWTVTAPDAMAIDLGPDWPFRGRVRQEFALDDDGLSVRLTLEADEAMPGAVGWHPWFRRTLAGTIASPRPPSGPVVLRFEPERMYRRGGDGLPTGELTDPGPRPWDDCFTGLHSAPRLTWPDRVALEIRSDCDHWVVYDERDEGLCVEPQTAPPDFPNIAPRRLEPGAPLHATMEWRWWPPAAGDR